MVARWPARRLPRRLGTFLLTLTILASPALFVTPQGACLAQLPNTELTSIFPAGAQQGTSVDVKVSGANLDELTGLVFSHPAIKVQPKMADPDGILSEPQPLQGQYVVEIPADVPAGAYEVRVVGAFGASNPRTFVVDGVPETIDDGSNKSIEKAKEISRDTIVNGLVDSGSRDYYAITLKKGERVLVECFAQRVDSRLDATVAIYNPEGRQIQRVRGGLDRDPLVDFTAPGDGQYRIAVSDFFYRGGNDYFYRLKVHAKPKIDFVIPAAAQAGSNSEYKIYGRNLPGGQVVADMKIDGQPVESITQKVNVPANARDENTPATGEYLKSNGALVDGFGFQLSGSNKIALGIADAPVHVEKEPNDQSNQAVKVPVPCDVTGQFYPARDQDWYQFDAKKGEVIWMEVISHRLGLDTDPNLIVQRVTKNDKGEEQVAEIAQIDDLAVRNSQIGSDFDTSTDDPSYRLEIKDDATYRVRVRDQFGDGRSDPRMIYRLALRREVPDFRLVAVPKARRLANNNVVPAASPVLRRGGSTLLEVTVARQDGFTGPVNVSVEGLPAGVQCSGAVVGGTVTKTSLVIHATDSANAWRGPIRVVGKAKIGDQEVTRTARAGTVLWSSTNRTQTAPEFRVARDIMLSVLESESDPATIQAGDGKVVETSRGAKFEIPVSITRRGEFKGDMKLSPTGLPNEIKPKEITVKGAAKDGKLAVEITNNNTKPGHYTFYLKSDVKFKYARNPGAVTKLEDRIKKVDEAINRINEEVKQATAARDEANKNLSAASGDAKKAAQDSKNKAEQALKDKQALQKRAQDLKKKLATDLNNVKKASAKKDVTVTLYSTPIVLQVHNSPFEVACGDMEVKAGDKGELAVKLQKKYAFDDNVDLTLELPPGVTGISGKGRIEKGKDSVNIQLTATDKATAGEHKVTLRARGRFNNVNVDHTRQFTLRIQPK